jgi:uncharacterized protein (DUF2342 family)
MERLMNFITENHGGAKVGGLSGFISSIVISTDVLLPLAIAMVSAFLGAVVSHFTKKWLKKF